MTITHTAYIALGSNLGDRHASLDEAIRRLDEHPGVRIDRVSAYHETAPVGGPPGQGPFLNAAARLHTSLSPEDLLAVLFAVEQQLGRVRTTRHGPRTIDLDLLIYEGELRDTPELTVPHPRLHERRFVLAPLADIDPSLVHPVLGRSVAELLSDLPADAASPQELAGRRAVVTGSTSGIGRAIAAEFARAGAEVIIHGRSAATAQTVVDAITARGGRARAVVADLSTEDGCAGLLAQTLPGGGSACPDIWVNNAGADTLTGDAARWPFEQKLAMLYAVDLRATMLLSRAAGERMKPRGGVLLTVGWDQAETGMEGDSGQLFAAIKGGVMAFTRSLAVTLAPTVRVNCLAPGWVRTAWGRTASSPWHQRVLRETPAGRWGTPEDVAATARWLVSPAGGFVTGQIIRVNGGAVR